MINVQQSIGAAKALLASKRASIQAAGTAAENRLNGITTITNLPTVNKLTIDASAIVSGVISPSVLGTGTPSDSTYLDGDGEWSTVSATLPDPINGGTF